MGFVLMKLTQGLAAILILLFFGISIYKFSRVIFKGLTKEKK